MKLIKSKMKSKRARDFQADCVHRYYAKDEYDENTTVLVEVVKFRECPSCERVMPLNRDHFHFNRTSANGVQQYHPECIGCRYKNLEDRLNWEPPHQIFPEFVEDEIDERLADQGGSKSQTVIKIADSVDERLAEQVEEPSWFSKILGRFIK